MPSPRITVLVENTTSDRSLRAKHGLSLLIEHEDERTLLDVGPDWTLLRNARTLGIDPDSVDRIVLSHQHIDHTGGLNLTLRANRHAPAHVFSTSANRLVAHVGPIRMTIGPRAGAPRGRLVVHEDDVVQLTPTMTFLRSTRFGDERPSLNANLWRRDARGTWIDDFDHEGVLVIEDGDDLIALNSCSHTGVLNSVNRVREAFPGRHIRSYVGGFHFHDPLTHLSAPRAELARFADWAGHTDIEFFTGHCTGYGPYMYLKDALGPDRVHHIRTGSVVEP